MSFAYRLNAFAARQITMRPLPLALKRPMASFTFDDFPRSAWEIGGPILARHGARGTYYAAGTYCGQTENGIAYYDEQTLRDVRAAGHEIGCHSYSHEHGPRVDPVLLEDDLDRNAIFLKEVLGEVEPLSFAYPYGEVSPASKRRTGERFSSCRGVHTGINAPLADLAQLRAIPLESRSWAAAKVERWVKAAKEANGWLIFFTHDVTASPSPHGCTPLMLEHAVAAAADAGFDLLPVKEALATATA